MALPGAVVDIAPTEPYDSVLNASPWANFTSWTMQHLLSTVNVTRYTSSFIAPSFEDLILAGPRILTKIGSFAIDGLPARVIAEATVNSDHYLSTTIADDDGLRTIFQIPSPPVVVTTAAASTVLEIEPALPNTFSSWTLESTKGFSSMFSYATSKWALTCIAMVLVLNRTHIFAASRRHLRLRWPNRLLLRGLPILFLLWQARPLLQSIQCQTSPDFADMKWRNASRQPKQSDFVFAYPGGYLHTFSQTLLSSEDWDSCQAVEMVPSNPHEQTSSTESGGSLSLLWPLYKTFCLSNFVETVSSAVQGRPVYVETAMTLFELSLAFAEADAAISHQLGWGLFSRGDGNINITSGGTPEEAEVEQETSGTTIAMSRSAIMKRVNTSPEVLFVAFLSAMSHLSSHVLAVIGLQSKLRLVNTGFWAMCFMTSIIVEFVRFSLDDPFSMGLFRYPTVCVIGFIPHLLMFLGIVLCLFIYGVALGLSTLSPPEGLHGMERQTIRGRFAVAHANMQANFSLSDIRITPEMDFYSALLRAGFAVNTMASEAVYLNEDLAVNVKHTTWLEEERFRRMENLRMQLAASTPLYDSAGAVGLVPVKEDQLATFSGYSRERSSQNVNKLHAGEKLSKDGVGAAERTSRWLHAAEFLINMNRLTIRFVAVLILNALARLGIRTQPRFLRWLASRPKLNSSAAAAGSTTPQGSPSPGVDKYYPPFYREDSDFEADLYQRLRTSPELAKVPEEDVDKYLYKSWKTGRLWGSGDSSGDWEPSKDHDDWDTTSMTNSVIGSEFGDQDQDLDPWEDDLDDGQRTPTQASPFTSRETTPMEAPIAMNDLARLLHPSSPEERQEAHALAAHLSSDRIMTRSQFARQQAIQHNRLFMTRPHLRGNGSSALSPDEESELLEQVILSRRGLGRQQQQAGQHKANPGSSVGGSSDTSADQGPLCVVCHSTPRSIIIWPCRCLSLCDDCRVTLAMNNFDKCVCCRREVVSFSRIYVP